MDTELLLDAIAKARALAQAVRRSRKVDSMKWSGYYVPLPLMDMTSDEIECLRDFDEAYEKLWNIFRHELNIRPH